MIDWAAIERFEGRALVGYVPSDHDGAPLGHSGATIAGGVDLGQVARDELARWPLSPGLLARLKPYAGIVSNFALRTLAAAPLIVSEAEAQAIDAAAQLHHVQALRDRYNAVVLPVDLPGFDELPDAVQTVLASLSFQYGANLAHACPKLWRMAVCQDWQAVVAELEDFHDGYATRRKAEAALLKPLLAA